MHATFDHAVVAVPDLERATADFTAAGFVVLPGGVHDAIPTRNALIVFADGGYLELLAPRDADVLESLRLKSSRRGWAAELRRASAIGRRFLPHLVGAPGVADYVLGTEHLARTAAEMRRRGFPASGPVAMRRERADGVRLEWHLLLPASVRLPMLIEDTTSRALRVPADPVATTHANGARGVAGVRVRAVDVAAAALECADFLGAAPRATATGAVLELAGLRVELVAGEPEGARAIVLRGAAAFPAAIEALGILGGA